MECAQLQITGGGSTQPATVSFPGAYKGEHTFVSSKSSRSDCIRVLGSDPGITINIYQTLKSYTVPGPAVFSCDGSSAPTQPPSPPVSSTVAAPPPHSSAPASSAPAPSQSGATAAHYAQCGGQGYVAKPPVEWFPKVFTYRLAQVDRGYSLRCSLHVHGVWRLRKFGSSYPSGLN